MSDLDDLVDQASKLSGDALGRFLSGLTVVQQREIKRRLSATVYPQGNKPDPQATTERGTGSEPPKPFTPPPRRPRGSVVPKSIGPYKILQPIGQGGMGQVFMAEQREPIRRRVAIKVINTEAPTDMVLARFEAERQSLAMMDHRNIAKVLDASCTEDGRPYFAMELVRGVPITDYCDSNRLKLDDRLELMIQVCQAIQHAHSKGVIHRDLKPSNVLVASSDDGPVAKVIDFGLAKAMHDQMQLTQRTLFTAHGQILGTLEYMSPEQAELNRLDIDARTDVYSLGVMLYELVTGTTPIGRDRIRSEAFDRILALIREERTPTPSKRLMESREAGMEMAEKQQTDLDTLTKRLKSGLDWIVLRSIEKDRAQRYEDVGQLGDDLQRFLRNETSLARAPSFFQRITMEYREHPLRSLVLTGLAFAVVGAAMLVARPSREQRVSTPPVEPRKPHPEAETPQPEDTIARIVSANPVDANGESFVDKTLELQGRWKTVVHYLPFTGFIPRARVEERKNIWLFAGHTLSTVRKPTLKTRAGFRGPVNFRSTETEGQFDFAGVDQEGQRQLWCGIYKRERGRLIVCFRPKLPNAAGPPKRPTSFSVQSQPDAVYMEFVRQ